MKRLGIAAVLTTLILAAPAEAQQDPLGLRAQGGQLRSDMLARDYFTARFVIANADAIGLSDEVRLFVELTARTAASDFVGLQFDLDTELRRLIGLSNVNPVDEEAVVEQLEVVLGLEREIKILQVRMAVRIRNALSVDQQEQLLTIRREARLRNQAQQR
ncbi:MAG: hypothetical protein GKS06_19550 [Acidobacteria bacterium]|nr:hypothetical protein [Acidobacteriota bacterium]